MSLKLIGLLLAIASISAGLFVTQGQINTIREQFEQWKAKHSFMLSLTPEEEEYRVKVFTDNLKVINEHNAVDGRSYDKGTNKFTAYTQEEF